jgi:hypothetical protein
MSDPPRSSSSAAKRPADDDAAPAKRAGSCTTPAGEQKTLRDVVAEQCANPCSWLHLVPRDMMRVMLLPLVPHDRRMPQLGRARIAADGRYVHADHILPVRPHACGRRAIQFAIYDYDGTNVLACYTACDGEHCNVRDSGLCAVYEPKAGTIITNLTAGQGFGRFSLPTAVWRSSVHPGIIDGEGLDFRHYSGHATTVIKTDGARRRLEFSLGWDYIEDASKYTHLVDVGLPPTTTAATAGLLGCCPHLRFPEPDETSIAAVRLFDLQHEIYALRDVPEFWDHRYSVHAVVGGDGTWHIVVDLTLFCSVDSIPFWRGTRCYAVRLEELAPLRAWSLDPPVGHVCGILVDCDDRLLIYTHNKLYWYNTAGQLLATITSKRGIIKVLLLRDGTLVLLHDGGWITTLQPAGDAVP